MIRFVSLLCAAVAVFAQNSGPDDRQVAFKHPTDPPKVKLSSIVDGAAFTTLAHPNFPSHQVRVKKTVFCDPTVK